MMIYSLKVLRIMTKFTTIYGIDVSMKSLDIYVLNSGDCGFHKIKNKAQAIETWIKGLTDQSCLFVLEHTGCYSAHLIETLSKHELSFSVVSPAQSNGFMMAQGIVSKDDRQAAKSLALMGQSLDLPLYQPIQEDMKKRKQLLMGINALKKQKQALQNQLHALDYQVLYAPKVSVALQATLQTVQEQLEELQQELDELSDEEHQTQHKLICSVKGIGSLTANLILSATGGLQNFDRCGQLSKFVGLVPYSHTSGSSVFKKGGITKKGNKDLRAALYMCARSARKYNIACKLLYDRLRAIGKPHKKAMVAVMNKLLKQAFAVVQSGVSFDNQLYLKFVEK